MENQIVDRIDQHQGCKSAIVLATPSGAKVSLIEHSNETGDSMLMLHSEGDIFLSAPNGRIHMQSKFNSREVGNSTEDAK